MNRAPAHLEWKLRFFELTVGQILVIVVAAVGAYAWAEYVSPLHGWLGAASAVYVAAVPAVPVVIASQGDLDVKGLVVGAVRWRRTDARYVPDEIGELGELAGGYVVSAPETDSDGEAGTGGVDLWLWTGDEQEGV